MKTKVFLLVTVVVLLLSVTACGAVSGLKTASDTGNSFMQALKDQDNEASWSMLSPAVQDEIGDTAAWADFTAPRGFESWKFNSVNVENGSAQLDGEASISGDTYDVTLVMDQSGEDWLITGINFTYQQ
jgi:hypothetical protein